MREYNLDVLNRARKKKKVRYIDLAFALNLSETTICKTLCGTRQGEKTLMAIAEELGVPWKRVAR